MRRKSERRERLRTERGKKSLNSEEKVKKQQQLDGKKKSVENSRQRGEQEEGTRPERESKEKERGNEEVERGGWLKVSFKLALGELLPWKCFED